MTEGNSVDKSKQEAAEESKNAPPSEKLEKQNAENVESSAKEDVVTQDESGASIATGETEASVPPSMQLVIGPEGQHLNLASKEINKYEFKEPNAFTDLELEQIKQNYLAIFRSISAKMSMLLRMEFGIKLKSISSTYYKSLLQKTSSPTYLALFNVEGLSGAGLLEINVRLAMTLINSMLGGSAQAVEEERFLSEIEVALLNDIAKGVIDDWCSNWISTVGPLKGNLIRVEKSPRFINSEKENFQVVLTEAEVELGDCCELIRFAIPFEMFDPIVSTFREAQNKVSMQAEKEKKAIWRQGYNNIPVPVVAEWKALSLPVKELIELKVGQVFKLPKAIMSETVVRLRNATRFIGDVGLQNDHVAVKLTKEASNDCDKK